MRIKQTINKIAVVSVCILVNIFFSCNHYYKKEFSDADTLTVNGSIVYIYDNFMEDSLLQKENINKDRRIIFEIKLKNNSSDYKYIPIHGLWDYKYKSKIGLYVDGADISGICIVKELNNNLLPPHDWTTVRIKVRDTDLKKAGLHENIPLSELLSRIKVRYDKDKKDTVYSKYPISDMKIVLDKDVVIEHKSYEMRKVFLLLMARKYDDIFLGEDADWDMAVKKSNYICAADGMLKGNFELIQRKEIPR